MIKVFRAFLGRVMLAVERTQHIFAYWKLKGFRGETLAGAIDGSGLVIWGSLVEYGEDERLFRFLCTDAQGRFLVACVGNLTTFNIFEYDEQQFFDELSLVRQTDMYLCGSKYLPAMQVVTAQ